MENQKPKILIGMPTMGNVHIFTMMQILTFMARAFQNGKYSIQIYPTVAVTPVDNARNEIVEEFLKSDCTHLFWIDSDTIPPAETLDRLLFWDKDMVSAITPIVEHDAARQNSDSNGFYKKYNCVTFENTFVEPHTGLVSVQGVGGSCLLVKRAVYEKIAAPWYRFIYADDNGKDCHVGEDIQFTAKVIAAGFKVFADTDLICGHYKGIIW